MIIYAADNDQNDLLKLIGILNRVEPKARIYGHTEISEILDISKKVEPDIVFLKTEPKTEAFSEAVQLLQEYNPDVSIVYIAENRGCAPEPIDQKAGGCLVKPISEKGVLRQLNNVKNSFRDAEDTEEKPDPVKKLRIQTFGNFEVFDSENHPVKFHYNKTKEMLAYLVDRRGAMCTIHEIMAVLWENSRKNEHASYFRNIRIDLVRTLKACGADGVIERDHGTMGICPDMVDCDLYDYLNETDEESRDAYFGEYMSQYSWSEATNSNLFFIFRSEKREMRHFR